MNEVFLSIIIPAYNESSRIRTTLFSIDRYLSNKDYKFEIIVVNDGSSDDTVDVVKDCIPLIKNLRLIDNQKNCGKGSAVKCGMLQAMGKFCLFMDADYSVTIDNINRFIEETKNGYEVVIGSIAFSKKIVERNGWHRRVLGSVSKFIIRNISVPGVYDTQRGFKLFTRKAVNIIFPKQTIQKFGFDIELLTIAKINKLSIKELPVDWDNPKGSKVTIWSYVQTTNELIEILLNRFLRRYNTDGSMSIINALTKKIKDLYKKVLGHIESNSSSYGKKDFSINYNNKIDFLFLPEVYSAKKHFYIETFVFLVLFLLVSSAIIITLNLVLGVLVHTVFSTAIVLFYLTFLIFKMWVIYYAIKDSPTIDFSKKQVQEINDDDLPVYTIIIPLYREELVIRQIIEAMSSIDYPTNKLDIIITLEEYDHPTINAIADANPPPYFKTLILPNVSPKTKPKALNVAFSASRGEFLVIYDAEIIPEPDQLKKAVLAFRSQPNVACFQTQLDHYNPRQSIITKLFNSEFSFHYDFFLPGLQRLGFPLPLSGHSTHFRTEVIRRIGAWDPYNVTEDCDLGIRLYRAGYSAGMIRSNSKEEATATVKSWVLQRTRWMKGFIQTSVVHLRRPLLTKKELGGWVPFIGFMFIVPGGVLVNILNFFSWIVLFTWFITNSTIISSFYPPTILYISVFCFILGTFFFTFMNLLSAYKRGRYDLVKYNLLSFVYWILLAVATVRAGVEFFTRPYHWEKTTHGAHIKNLWRIDPTLALRKFKSYFIKYSNN